MPTKHTATHDGHTFKRTSAGRVYTHAVIATYNIADDRALAEQATRAEWKMNLSYYQGYVDGTSKFLVRQSYQTAEAHSKDCAQHIAHAKERLALGVDGYVAQRLEIFDASIVLRSSDGLSYYMLSGWCSRPDLAQKLAARTRGAVIVEAVRP